MNDEQLMELVRWLPWLSVVGLLAGVVIVYWIPKSPTWLAIYGGLLTLIMLGVTR